MRYVLRKHPQSEDLMAGDAKNCLGGKYGIYKKSKSGD